VIAELGLRDVAQGVELQVEALLRYCRLERSVLAQLSPLLRAANEGLGRTPDAREPDSSDLSRFRIGWTPRDVVSSLLGISVENGCDATVLRRSGASEAVVRIS
jgi:hypothetical protein